MNPSELTSAKILLKTYDSSLIVVGENVEPLEIEEAAMRSNLIQQIVVIGQVLVGDFDLGTVVWAVLLI